MWREVSGPSSIDTEESGCVANGLSISPSCDAKKTAASANANSANALFNSVRFLACSFSANLAANSGEMDSGDVIIYLFIVTL